MKKITRNVETNSVAEKSFQKTVETLEKLLKELSHIKLTKKIRQKVNRKKRRDRKFHENL
jgi:prefoldin subunit 5